MCWVRVLYRSTHTPCRSSYEKRAVLVLVIVAAEGLAVDEGERGDDEDDAGRCRSDARGQPSTAFAAAERVGGTVARAGADITREREKKFPNRPLLYLPETEAAESETAACTMTDGRAWLSEEDLWVVCSVWTAALACTTLVFLLKEHRSFDWKELFSNGLLCGTSDSVLRATR